MKVKEIPNTNGHYTVSDTGVVFKDNAVVNYSLGGGSAKGKYKMVVIKFNEIGWKPVYIHRLVAEAFVPNPLPEVNTVVNHIDENHMNNNVENLEWVTHAENCRKASSLKERGMGSIKHKFLAALNKDDEIVAVYETIASAAKINSPEKWQSAKTCINFCILYPDINKTALNFKWRRINKDEFDVYKDTIYYNRYIGDIDSNIKRKDYYSHYWEENEKPGYTVSAYYQNGELYKTYVSFKAACRELGTYPLALSKAIESGRLLKGYIWKK